MKPIVAREWLFFALLAAFGLIYLSFYPAGFGIADESEILTLAYSLAHGTIHPDTAGVITYNSVMERAAGAHRVVIYSPFNAALFVPAVLSQWRAAFLVSAAFFVIGAFAMRSILKRENFAVEWSILYFLLPGMLYYASTLKEAVPAGAMGLVGVAMLTRERPRPVAGGLAMGAAVLLHQWMAAMVLAYSAVWWLERGARDRRRAGVLLAIGAAPAILVLAAYDRIAFGSVLVSSYVADGKAFAFRGPHFSQFFPFYIASLAIFPIAGWAALSPRWSKGWATPAAVASVVLMASLYGYRDGMTSGLHGVAALIAGAIPGQRFLLPASAISCLPASRWLDARLTMRGWQWTNATRAAALAIFVIGYGSLAALHQNFLRANGIVQRAIATAMPDGAILIGNGDILKELAPVYRIVDYRVGDNDESLAARTPNAYVAWLVAPGAKPPTAAFVGRRAELVRARSWVWNRDLWIGFPLDSNAADGSASPGR